MSESSTTNTFPKVTSPFVGLRQLEPTKPAHDFWKQCNFKIGNDVSPQSDDEEEDTCYFDDQLVEEASAVMKSSDVFDPLDEEFFSLDRIETTSVAIISDLHHKIQYTTHQDSPIGKP